MMGVRRLGQQLARSKHSINGALLKWPRATTTFYASILKSEINFSVRLWEIFVFLQVSMFSLGHLPRGSLASRLF